MESLLIRSSAQCRRGALCCQMVDPRGSTPPGVEKTRHRVHDVLDLTIRLELNEPRVESFVPEQGARFTPTRFSPCRSAASAPICNAGDVTDADRVFEKPAVSCSLEVYFFLPAVFLAAQYCLSFSETAFLAAADIGLRFFVVTFFFAGASVRASTARFHASEQTLQVCLLFAKRNKDVSQ